MRGGKVGDGDGDDSSAIIECGLLSLGKLGGTLVKGGGVLDSVATLFFLSSIRDLSRHPAIWLSRWWRDGFPDRHPSQIFRGLPLTLYRPLKF